KPQVAHAPGDVQKPGSAGGPKEGGHGGGDAAVAAPPSDASAHKPGDSGHQPGDGGVRQGTTTVDRAAEKTDPVDVAALNKINDDPRVQKAQDKLNESIDKKLEGLGPDDPKRKELEQFRKDREDFEARAASMKPPLSPEEVAKTEEKIL